MQNGNILSTLLNSPNGSTPSKKNVSAPVTAETNTAFKKSLQQRLDNDAIKKPPLESRSTIKHTSSDEPKPSPKTSTYDRGDEAPLSRDDLDGPPQDEEVQPHSLFKQEKKLAPSNVQEEGIQVEAEVDSINELTVASYLTPNVLDGNFKLASPLETAPLNGGSSSLLSSINPATSLTEGAKVIDSSLLTPMDGVMSDMASLDFDAESLVAEDPTLTPAIDTLNVDCSFFEKKSQSISLGEGGETLLPKSELLSRLDTKSSSVSFSGQLSEQAIEGADLPDVSVAQPIVGDDTLLGQTEIFDFKLGGDLLMPKSKVVFQALLDAQPLVEASGDSAKITLPLSSGLVDSVASPAMRGFVAQSAIGVNVMSPQWSEAVANKVLWFAAQNISSAEIRLDPPELGPMQVKIALHQDQVNVNFTSPHAQVRDALDLQLNRLRDMFAEQGMNLVNVDVSDKSFRQQEREERGSAATEPDVDTDTQSDGTVTQVVNLRLVDHYA